MGVASVRSLLRADQLVLAPDHLRQARHRTVRPRHRGADPRAADRRRPGGHGRRGVRAGGPFRDLRGRADERPVRGHSPRSRDRSGALRRHGAHHRGARLPLGLARGGASRVRRRVHRPLLGATRRGDGRALRSELRGRSPRRRSSPPVWSAPPRVRRWSSRSSRCFWTSMCEPSCPRSMFRRSSSTGAATGSSIDAPARSSPSRSRTPDTWSFPGSTICPGQATRKRVLGEIEEFLTGARSVAEPDRVLATVMFTDIVGSTERAGELGDARWRELLAAHQAAVRRELDAVPRTRGEDAGRRLPRHLRRPGAGDPMRARDRGGGPLPSAWRCASASTAARSS